ncbi:LmbE family N-acetylglucosaminyl deacetylase [Dyadobacter jejuensis]|uniref:LmbE family N-acetylglucosaminyl deacetylase n=1 Tax=Dyadobacter jejuensis TaxID=1082580 RepID=A0A316AL62_9BACT|nr:PIG-L family deacetylase [Dyadobacter jejuensis]PWJ58503.1 LmbE family N-acetylglucosaminyl deacetylase [Dyadobacter jejuensis]
MQKRFLTLLFSCLITSLSAQTPPGEIYQNIKKLNVLGSALYIAAHPDDENTLMLAYLAKDRLVRTGYMSLTRGDGGQNLIGSEQGYNIGLIRTQELLAARKNDGAEQFFSRAYDFGYSKTREETLKFWDEEKVLGDVVWMIRKFQPDVLITRFPPDPRAGHGHHQTSAYLAEKAFTLAADPTSYPEQLKTYPVWQAKRLVWNTYTPGFTNRKPSDTEQDFIGVELGDYNPLLGKAYTEIAAESRSQHKSQAFGAAPARGQRADYLLHTKGERAKTNLFDGIDLTWNRVKGGAAIEKLVQKALDGFDISAPEKSIPQLIAIYKGLQRLDEGDKYVNQKKEEVKELLVQCLGLWFETNPTTYSGVAGKPVNLKMTVVKRSAYPVQLSKVFWTGMKADSAINLSLANNELVSLERTTVLPVNLPISQPYWIEKPLDKGMFNIPNQKDIGYPENRSKTISTYTFMIDGQPFTYQKAWEYKFTDPAEGEIYRPFEIRPLVTVNLADPVIVFPDASPREVLVTVQAQAKAVQGKVSLTLPSGWKSTPADYSFDLPEQYQQASYSFQVSPTDQQQNTFLKAQATVSGRQYDKSIRSISYRHIPTQTLFPEAEAKLTKMDIHTTAKHIGYIAGAGDEVPSALRQIGCQVTMLDEAELSKDLSMYDAIVVGVRAYNTETRLGHYQAKLMEYVKNGGTMVVQYTIPSGLKVSELGPYPLTTGRDRITEEDATLHFLNPKHPVLNIPNKITQKDFDGWIQERGLYFAQTWDKQHYEPILAGHDTGEGDLDGALLYAQYGKGVYIYTGLSFFRELPAGVSGAYRLFANIISAGQP